MANNFSNSIHPSLLLRKIIHVDMDAFYASVEIRDNPKLQGLPVIVGGPPNSRSVVSTASYAARKFGVRSAMASSVAARLCPDAIFIRPNFEKYSAVAQQLREIFATYTPLVEPMSLDEAYLDVTNNPQGLFAVKIARSIKDTILHETGLTASAGVAPNKLVAKIASDFNKPNGLTVVIPEKVESFMADLPVRKLPGVGPVTERELVQKGLLKCRDIRQHSAEQLEELLGNRAEWLGWAAQGIDTSPVETHWERKSLGEEETLATDLTDLNAMTAILRRIADSVHESMSESGRCGRTIQVKVKYSDFKTVTRRRSFSEKVDNADMIYDTARELLTHTEAGKRPIRLLGISMSNFVD